VVVAKDRSDAGTRTRRTGRDSAAGRQRLRRWGASLAVAAGVVTFAAIGVTGLRGGSDDGGLSSTAGRPAADPGVAESVEDSGAGAPAEGGQDTTLGEKFQASPSAPGEMALPSAGQVSVSGRSYTASSLPGTARQLTENAPLGAEEAPQPFDERALRGGGVDPTLTRLTAPEALDACLDAIATERGGGTAAVVLADFATFEGVPALVVLFTVDATGGKWVWAVGGDCGLPMAGADTRYRSPVG